MVIIEHKKGSAQKKQTGFHEDQKVALLISARTEMGFIAVINGTHKGILYKNEVFQPLKTGQEIDGFIKKVRDDKKIDLCLQKPGYKAIDALSRNIMDKLQLLGGFIAVTDKSRPKVVADLFGVSKKRLKLPAAPFNPDVREAPTSYGECARFCGSRRPSATCTKKADYA